MCFQAVPIHMTTTWPSEYTNLLVSFRRISGSWNVRASIWDKPVTPATSRMAFRRLWVSDSILWSSWGSAKSKSGTIAASGAMWMGLGGCSSSSLSFSVDFLSLDLAALRFSVFWALSISLWTSSLNLPYTLALFLSQTSGLHPAVGTMNTQSAMLSVGKSREGHYLEGTVPAVRAWEWINAFSVADKDNKLYPRWHTTNHLLFCFMYRSLLRIPAQLGACKKRYSYVSTCIAMQLYWGCIVMPF